jgi:hypothetical protein
MTKQLEVANNILLTNAGLGLPDLEQALELALAKKADFADLYFQYFSDLTFLWSVK